MKKIIITRTRILKTFYRKIATTKIKKQIVVLNKKQNKLLMNLRKGGTKLLAAMKIRKLLLEY